MTDGRGVKSKARRVAAPPPADVDVSVIICTRDRCDDLRQMLEHLGRARVPDGWRVELLVVDNGSSDDTRAVAETANAPNLERRYVFAPEKGKGYAYNAGLAAARGKALLFTDDDVHVPVDWIERMCAPILDGSADAVQGAIHIAPHLERPWLQGALRTWVAAVESPNEPPEGLVGANMALGRAAIDFAGPFDLRLGPGAAGFFDDTLVGWALQRAGKKILYLPDVAVEHNFAPDPPNLESLMGIARRMAVSRAIVDPSLGP